MAFPSVRSSQLSTQATDATTFNLVLPATVVAGDLLLAFVSLDDGSTSTITWDNSTAGTWTLIQDEVRSTAIRAAIYAKVADGTEDGLTLGLTISSVQRGVMRAYAIQNWYGSLSGVTSAFVTQATANADPPSLSPSWGAEDSLWIAYVAIDANTPATGYPTGFADNQSAQNAGAGPGTGDGFATQNLNTATLNPSAFTNTANGSVVTTLAVRPAAAASAAITGTSTSSITESDVVTGGKTTIITLTSDTWLAAGTGPIGSTANTQAIIDGITSAQSETLGWNNEVRDNESTSSVVRTSSTVATITWSAAASYNITATETITVTVPGAALTGGSPIVATPTFTVSAAGGATVYYSIDPNSRGRIVKCL